MNVSRLILITTLVATLGSAARAEVVSTGDLAVRIEAAMRLSEKIATDTSFPKANTIAEIAKGIRSVVYARDLTPEAMLAALDAVAATPLSEVAAAAVRSVREEIVYGG